MESDFLSGLRTVLELGWPAIVLIIAFLLWRALWQVVWTYIEDLREIAGMKANLRPPADETPVEAPKTVKARRASRPGY